MDLYMSRYWSLYLDFVDALGSLRYRGIPLALVGNFYKYLSTEQQAAMRSPDHAFLADNRIVELGRIQPEFEQRIARMVVRKPTGRPKGWVAVCSSLLRFPPSMFDEYFHPAKTVLLNDSEQGVTGKVYGIPVHNLRTWGQDTDSRSARMKSTAKHRLARWNSRRTGLVDSTLQSRFLQDIPAMVRLIDQADRYLSRNPVSCIVVGTTELMLARVLALVGRRRGIPTLCLQHGMIAVEESYMPVFADKYAVYGFRDMEWYARRGVPKHRIEVTGHPRFDAIRTLFPCANEKFRKLTGMPMDGKRLLIATQPHIGFQAWERMTRALAGMKELRILIKPHPLEEVSGVAEKYRKLSGLYPNVYVTERRVPLYDLLPHMDFVVVESSTVGLEGLLNDRTVFFLYNRETPVYKEMSPYMAKDPAYLKKLIKAYLNSEQFRAAYRNAGKAFLRAAYPVRLSAPQVVRLIEQLSGTRCRPRISWLRDGMLLKGEGPAIYAIQQGMRRQIASPKVLVRLLGPKRKVRSIHPDTLKRIPLGEPIV